MPVATDHAAIDYRMLGRHAQFLIDTRNAMKAKGLEAGNVVKA